VELLWSIDLDPSLRRGRRQRWQIIPLRSEVRDYWLEQSEVITVSATSESY
jgi:hypothetical protein